MVDISQIPISLENVEQVVNEFYETSQLPNEFKPQLEQWLKNAQNSPEAWSFSWNLIDMSKSVNCQFYGAMCLYNKVSKYLHEVPREELDNLKNRLLEKLLLYASNLASMAAQTNKQQIKLIERKLNSTLAKLALYLCDDQWQNCIQDIIHTIPNCCKPSEPTGANSDDQTMNNQKLQLLLIVIDLITLLPEEFQTISNTINKLKRSQIFAKLKKDFHIISNYIINLFNSININQLNAEYYILIENSIKCLTSWVEFGIEFTEIDVFLNYLFIYIYNEKLFEHSAECLTSLLSSEETLKYSNSLFKYTHKILELNAILKKYVNEKDTDGCVVLTKLILAFAENQISCLFDTLLYGDQASKQLIVQFFQLIISLSSMPGNFPVDEESSDLTFVFWYSLQDTLLAMEQKSAELQQIFRPFFINLLEIFIQKLKLADDYDKWSEEEKERLRCYRIDIGDTMVYMISFIGEIMLEFIIKKLINTVEQTPNDWKTIEALIYMLQSVVSELNESCSPDFSYNNDSYLISFMNLLPKIIYCNKHILSTTLLAVGSLGNWLERNQNVLPNAISLCILGLKTESVTQSASFAIKDIINDCELSQYADQIIQACQECLRMTTIAHNYEVRLMSIIGLCISDLLVIDMERSLRWLQTIIEPYILKLNELALLKTTDKQSQASTCHVINLASQLMSSLIQRQKTHEDHETQDESSISISNASLVSPNKSSLNVTNGGRNSEREIVNSILVKLIPIYKVIINRNLPGDVIIIDKLFESVSVTLSSSLSNKNSQTENESFEFILNDLIGLFYQLNENSWRRYAYEVCRQILIIWWRTDKYKPMLENLFLFSHQNAMKLMSKDMNWFHEHTDVVEQYSTCLAKLLKSKYYDLFERLNEEALLYLIRFIQLGLQLPEQYTLRSVVTFIEEFVKFTKLKNHLMGFIEQNAFNLIQIALLGITGGLPRHLVDLLSGTLYIFLKEYPQLTNTILTNILIKMDFQPFNVNQQPNQPNANPTALLSKEQKTVFIRSLLSESNNKRKFKEIVNEFSLNCRGLANTQYGKDTSQKY